MYLRCYTEKMGQFELSEPKNLCYTSSNFAFWNYFPQEPVLNCYTILNSLWALWRPQNSKQTKISQFCGHVKFCEVSKPAVQPTVDTGTLVAGVAYRIPRNSDPINFTYYVCHNEFPMGPVHQKISINIENQNFGLLLHDAAR